MRLHIANKRNIKKYVKWIFAITICISLFFALSNNKVRTVLLPGNPQVTERALTELVENMRHGDSIKDAVTVFCREILENA